MIWSIIPQLKKLFQNWCNLFMSLTSEETNLRMMEQIDNYANWQFDVLKKHITGDVLEIGAGVGTITRRILAKKDVTSCSVTEISKENHKYLMTHFTGKCQYISDINLERELPYGFVGRFDTVFSSNVMEHVRNDKVFFANCVKCLKPKGKIVKLVPAVMTLFGTIDVADNHYRRYDYADLKKLAETNRLNIKQLFYMNLAGAIGWAYHGKFLKRKTHIAGDLKAMDAVSPVLQKIEGVVRPPLGISLILVAEKP